MSLAFSQNSGRKLGMKTYLERFKAYFTKLFYGKSTFRMLLQDYMNTMMLHFINNRSKMFNFKTFKIVLLAAINSKIVTASLLLNLYCCY